MKLWIAFHHHAGEKLDDWEVYLEGENVAECEIWAAIGSTCAFRAMHLIGVHSESMPGYKDKYLLKDELTLAEVEAVRKAASGQPIDNEADFWDGRIYCFEIINQLEREGVLDREGKKYRFTRRMLRAKWMTGDGTMNWDSDELEMCHGGESSAAEEEEEGDKDAKGVKVETQVNGAMLTNGLYLSQ